MPKVAKTGHTLPAARTECKLNYHNGFIYLWGGALHEENEGA